MPSFINHSIFTALSCTAGTRKQTNKQTNLKGGEIF